jgi:photosystem II stability/assembly factor-like uncharacterized protein
MKAKYFLFSVILMSMFFPILSHAQWLQKYEGSQFFLKIDAPDQNTVFAVGNNGAILRTINSGSSWELVQSNTTSQLYDVAFPGTTTGYICGANGVLLKTTDGGSTWNPCTTGTTLHLRSLCFLDESTGYISGSSASDPFQFGADSGIILKTINGGQSFTTSYTSAVAVQAVRMFDVNTGIAVCNGPSGSPGTIVRTTDAGSTWGDCFQSPPDNPFTSLETFSTGLAYAAGYMSPGATTADFGGTWAATFPSGPATWNISFPSPQTGYFAGFDPMAGGSISKLSNGGQLTPQISGNFTTVDFVDDTIGYAATADGEIYKTINGGELVGIPSPGGIGASGVTIFPNPFSNFIHAEIKGGTTQQDELKFEIYSPSGDKLVVKNFRPPSFTCSSLASLSCGLYYAVISCRNAVIFSGKVIKKE